MASLGYFYGMESGGKLYKVYVTEGALCGAKVAGQVYDAKSAHMMTFHFGLLGMLFNKKVGAHYAKKREEAEAKFDAMEAGGPVFLTADKANFSLGQSAIARIEINPKRTGLKNMLKSEAGVEVHLSDGKKRRFVLIGEQNVEYISSLLTRVVPSTTLVE